MKRFALFVLDVLGWCSVIAIVVGIYMVGSILDGAPR